MQKTFIVIGIILIILFGLYAVVSKNQNTYNTQSFKLENKGADNVRNATYTIESQEITLSNGLSEIAIPNSSSKITTRYFGNNVTGDFNSDNYEDEAFLLSQDNGGSGIFYYVVVAFLTDKGYQGSNAILLGDRIAPQTTEISNGKIIVNYADRKPNEPMTARPSIGISKTFGVIGTTLIEVK